MIIKCVRVTYLWTKYNQNLVDSHVKVKLKSSLGSHLRKGNYVALF